jgi:hypothetical protein
VSEGHYIAEAARHAVLKAHHVLDVMVHIDPEDDMQAKPNAHLPNRLDLLQHLATKLDYPHLLQQRLVFHYLDGKVDAEIYLALDQDRAQVLQQQCDELVKSDAIFRSILILKSGAQQ